MMAEAIFTGLAGDNAGEAWFFATTCRDCIPACAQYVKEVPADLAMVQNMLAMAPLVRASYGVTYDTTELEDLAAELAQAEAALEGRLFA